MRSVRGAVRSGRGAARKRGQGGGEGGGGAGRGGGGSAALSHQQPSSAEPHILPSVK